MNLLLVVEILSNWPLDSSGARVVLARDYLTKEEFAQMKNVKVFNLCRSYRYQSIGYYVSLLAAARGHKPLPGVTTMTDLKLPAVIRLAAEELEDLINESLAPLQSEEFTLSIYFGRNMAKRYDRLSSKLFKLFPAPLMRAVFIHRKKKGWQLKQLNAIPASEIPDSHRSQVVEFAREFIVHKAIPHRGELSSTRYSMAILCDPDEAEPPSDSKALARFQRVAEKMGFGVEMITREDYGRVAEFDALFIRETTNVNHHTYRFARRAQFEGLVVIDDPDSILRCSNKVFQAEILSRGKIQMPRTVIVHKDNIEEAIGAVGIPCVLKKPDSAFSLGVHKLDSPEQFIQEARRLLDKSDLVIAQEFLPTSFDWRVGVLDHEPLYVCKYHMAKDHWQVVKRDHDGRSRWGRFENFPLWQAPSHVVKTALRAADLVGDGFYGVDLKEIGGRAYVMEVNDNPDIIAGIEDADLKDELYERLVQVFLDRIEKIKEGKAQR